MKKSFKKSIAVLLSVLMMVCVMPFSAFAADSKPNVNLQFNAFSITGKGKTFQNYTGNWFLNDTNLKKFGIYSAPLDYDKNAGTLTLSAAKAQTTSTAKNWGMAATGDYTYGVGDYFTVTVRLDNISKLAAAQVALQYSNNIEPAGLYQKTAKGFEFYSISDNKTDGQYSDLMDTARAGYPIPTQSAKGLYSGLNDGLVGDASYIDSDNRIIHTYVSNQDANSSTSVASLSDADLTNADGSKGNTYANQAVLATYAFKIIGTGAITFSMADASSVDDCYYIADEKDGTDPKNYITYAQTDNAGSTGITFMGKNEFVAGTKYTITFKDVDDSIISQADYDEGARINIPDLPTKAPDADYHYTYAWDTTPAATATDNAVYTAVETATRHTMSEEIIKDATTTETGEKRLTCDICQYSTTEIIPVKTCNHVNTTTSEEVTKEATCKEEGSKTVTVTCSDCHTVVRTEVVAIPKSAHKLGAYVYNGDATTTADGTMSATCSICGEKETKVATGTSTLVATTYTLSLQSSLVMGFRIPKANIASNIENVSVVVTRGTKTLEQPQSEFATYTNSKGVAYWQINFDQMPPQTMGDDVTCIFHGTIDGVEVYGPAYVSSVKFYCDTMLGRYLGKTNATYKKLCTLLVDLLNYGAAAQIYSKYNTENLVNADLSEAALAVGTQTTPTVTNAKNLTYSVLDGAKITWNNTTLALSEAVIPKVRFVINDSSVKLEDVTVNITVGTKATYSYSYAEFPELFAASAKGCYFSFPGLNANNMSEILYCTVSVDGQVVSDTMTYSAESYAYAAQSLGSAYQTLKDLTINMVKYGNAAKAYAG